MFNIIHGRHGGWFICVEDSLLSYLYVALWCFPDEVFCVTWSLVINILDHYRYSDILIKVSHLCILHINSLCYIRLSFKLCFIWCPDKYTRLATRHAVPTFLPQWKSATLPQSSESGASSHQAHCATCWPVCVCPVRRWTACGERMGPVWWRQSRWALKLLIGRCHIMNT